MLALGNPATKITISFSPIDGSMSSAEATFVGAPSTATYSGSSLELAASTMKSAAAGDRLGRFGQVLFGSCDDLRR